MSNGNIIVINNAQYIIKREFGDKDTVEDLIRRKIESKLNKD